MTDRILATLCYVKHNNRVLLMHRNKEPNLNLWIAPGGKLEFDESPQECALRELYEETGLRVSNPQLRGLITEVSPRDDYQWLIFIFVADLGDGQSCEITSQCSEGKLAWVPIDQVQNLPIPKADAIFFSHIIHHPGPLFHAKFVYDSELGIVDWVRYE